MVKAIPWNETLSQSARRSMFVMMKYNKNADDGDYRRKEAPASEGWFLPGDLWSIQDDDFRRAEKYHDPVATRQNKMTDTWKELEDTGVIEVKKLRQPDRKGRFPKKSYAFRLKRDILGFNAVRRYLEIYPVLKMGYLHSRYLPPDAIAADVNRSKGPSFYAVETEKLYTDWQLFDALCFSQYPNTKIPVELAYINDLLPPGFHKMPPISIDNLWVQQKRAFKESEMKPPSIKSLGRLMRENEAALLKLPVEERRAFLQRMKEMMMKFHKKGLLFQCEVDYYKVLKEKLLDDESKVVSKLVKTQAPSERESSLVELPPANFTLLSGSGGAALRIQIAAGGTDGCGIKNPDL